MGTLAAFATEPGRISFPSHNLPVTPAGSPRPRGPQLRDEIHALRQLLSLSHCPHAKYEANSHCLWIKLWTFLGPWALGRAMGLAEHSPRIENNSFNVDFSITCIRFQASPGDSASSP